MTTVLGYQSWASGWSRGYGVFKTPGITGWPKFKNQHWSFWFLVLQIVWFNPKLHLCSSFPNPDRHNSHMFQYGRTRQQATTYTLPEEVCFGKEACFDVLTPSHHHDDTSLISFSRSRCIRLNGSRPICPNVSKTRLFRRFLRARRGRTPAKARKTTLIV